MRDRRKKCPDCFREFRKSVGNKIKAANNGIPWGRGQWPDWIHHDQPTKHCFKHHAERLASSASYRTRKMRAMPKWANQAAIRAIYEQCMRVTQETGVPHAVDHIVPLAGRRVCGLHVHWNLRVITARDNCIKSNRF